MNPRALYERFAKLLSYPDDNYLRSAEICHSEAARLSGEICRHLAEFRSRIEARKTDQLQELFVQTFDLNPVCVLEVGWHLYGDNYDRGAFLVKTREQLRRHEITESRELPDHLTHVLALLARMEPEAARAFAAERVVPAVDKMLAGMADKASPFEPLLKALRQALACTHKLAHQEVNHE